MVSKEHDELKEYAVEALIKKGFKDVATEVSLWLCTDLTYTVGPKVVHKFTRKRPRIDVVGVSDEKTVAVECGDVSEEKLVQISKLFDEVYHLNRKKHLRLHRPRPWKMIG